jgi:hypothetical protein
VSAAATSRASLVRRARLIRTGDTCDRSATMNKLL